MCERGRSAYWNEGVVEGWRGDCDFDCELVIRLVDGWGLDEGRVLERYNSLVRGRMFTRIECMRGGW